MILFFIFLSSFQAYGIVDTVMEHLAVTSGLDPVDFRTANIQSQHPLPDMIAKLKQEGCSTELQYFTRGHKLCLGSQDMVESAWISDFSAMASSSCNISSDRAGQEQSSMEIQVTEI